MNIDKAITVFSAVFPHASTDSVTPVICAIRAALAPLVSNGVLVVGADPQGTGFEHYRLVR